MRVLAIFSALLSVGFATCYLEDSNAKCAVCWKTTYAAADDSTGVTKMSECDDAKVKVSWVTSPPDKMFELTDYPVKWMVSTPGFNVSQNDVPHANVHSCIANRGACTPFVANSPGLATHTSALTSTLEEDDAGIRMSYFETTVNLKNDQYTIIAHTRIHVNEDGQPKPPRYDIAIGLSRTVTLEDVTSSTGSIITAAVAGGCLFIIIMSVIWAARSGKISLEAIMVKTLNGGVIGVVALLIGLGDVIAFTFTLINLYENPTVATADILPVACMILGIGWVISIAKATHDVRRLYDNFYLGGQRKIDSFAQMAAAYLAKEEVQADRRMRRKSSTTSLESVAIDASEGPLIPQVLKRRMTQVRGSKALLEAATDLVKTNHRIQTLYMVVLTLFLEQIPLCVISMYLLVMSDEVIIADGMTLLISSIILGGNCIRLLGFPVLAKKKRGLLLNFTSASKAAPVSQPDLQISESPRRVEQYAPESPRRLSSNGIAPNQVVPV